MILAALALSGTAAAQGGAGQVGEVVIAADGMLKAPWVERKVCDEEKCFVMVVSTATREVARLDGRLTSSFKATGSGKEIVRAHDKRG